MKRFLPIAAALLCLGGTACAEEGFINCPMRELAAGAETTVVAAPIDPAAPARFKVLRVLGGTALKEGDLFDVEFASLDWKVPAPEGTPGYKSARFVEALLFLGAQRPGTPIPQFSLTPMAARFLTAEGAVCYASEPLLSSGCFLQVYYADFSWTDLLRKAKADAAEVRHVHFLKAGENIHRRNAALLDWIERRRREFGDATSIDNGKEPNGGWGSLEQDVFQWILESRIPADCWAAVKLYAELNEGRHPEIKTPAFGCRSGRELLLSVAADDSALTGDRVRALRILALPLTIWPSKADVRPDVEPLDEKEQSALIDHLTLMLKDPNVSIRDAAVQAILEASSPPVGAATAAPTQRALLALEATYKSQAPGCFRNELAEAVVCMGGPKRWQELTGNAHGILVLIDDFDYEGDAEGLCFYRMLHAKNVGRGLTLVLERLDDKGAVVETKEQTWELPKVGGLFGPGPPIFGLSMTRFSPGVWRITLKGVAGEDSAPWTSEPRLLHLVPAQPGNPAGPIDVISTTGVPGAETPTPDLKTLRITFDP